MSLSAWKGVGQGKGESSKVGGHCVHTSFFLWAFFCQVWSHRFSLVLLFALLFSGFAFAVAFSQLLRILFSKTRRRGRRGGGGEGNDSVRRVQHRILQADYYASFFMFFAMRERRSSCLPCEKHVPGRFRQPTNIKFRLEIHVWESQPLRGSMIGAVVCGPSLSMIGVVSFAAGNQYLIARFWTSVFDFPLQFWIFVLSIWRIRRLSILLRSGARLNLLLELISQFDCVDSRFLVVVVDFRSRLLTTRHLEFCGNRNLESRNRSESIKDRAAESVICRLK